MVLQCHPLEILSVVYHKDLLQVYYCFRFVFWTFPLCTWFLSSSCSLCKNPKDIELSSVIRICYPAVRRTVSLHFICWRVKVLFLIVKKTNKRGLSVKYNSVNISSTDSAKYLSNKFTFIFSCIFLVIILVIKWYMFLVCDMFWSEIKSISQYKWSLSVCMALNFE